MPNEDNGVLESDEAKLRARAGIWAWIGRAGHTLLRTRPQAILTAMTAAAFAPILVPLLGNDPSLVVGGLIAQLGNVGGEHLSNVLHAVVRRLRGADKVVAVTEELVANLLEQALEQHLAGPHASMLWAEIVQVLHKVDAVHTALEAAVNSRVDGLYTRIGQSVGMLSDAIVEVRALRTDLEAAQVVLQSGISQVVATQLVHTAKLNRIAAQLSIDRRQVTLGRLADPPTTLSGTLESPSSFGAGDVPPYPGLAAFKVDDARWFHGRESLIAELVTRLRGRQWMSTPLIVTGASGAGKSSLLQAGLIPVLESGGLEPGSEDWPYELLTPGRTPLSELAIRLTSLAGLPSSAAVLDDLTTQPDRAPLIIRQALLRSEQRQRRRRNAGPTTRPSGHSVARRLVLVIDQFEELFTQVGEHERQLFIEAICAAATGGPADPASALVVIGLRGGFVEQCTAHPELAPALRDQLIVGPMSVSELRAAIENPARQARLAVEDGLSDVMLSDLETVVSPTNAEIATYDPGKLPLLAYALRETWEHRGDAGLTLAAYHDAGGIKEAITKKAERVYGALDTNAQRVARQLLEQLVSTRPDAEDTRRLINYDALLAQLPPQDAATAEHVLGKLDRERLVIMDEGKVQIIHEAVLRQWWRLAAWMAEHRTWMAVRQRLDDEAHDWDDNHRRPDLLLPGGRLSVINEQLDDSRRASLGPLQTLFLHASQRRKARAERVRRLVVLLLIVAVVVTGGLAVVAQANSAEARIQQANAQSRALAARADTLRATNPEAALLLSLEAYRTYPTMAATSSLLSTQAGYFTARRIPNPSGPVNAVAWTPNADRLVSGAQDGTVTVWHATNWQPLAVLHGSSAVYAVAIDPTGQFVAAAEANGTTRLWNIDTARPAPALTVDSDAVDTVAFSPDGTLLATGGYDGTIRFWRTATLTVAATIRIGYGPVSGVAFSPDGSRLAAACADGTVRLYDVADTATPVLALAGHASSVRSVAFSADSTLLASGGDDATVRLWDARTGVARGVLTGSTGPVRSVAFTPDSTQLASAGEDNAVRLWDVGTKAQTAALTGPTNTVADIAFSPDGHALVSADHDATIGLWNIAVAPTPGNTAVTSVASGTGNHGVLVTAAPDQRITVWNPAERIRITTFGPTPGSATDVAVSPDQTTLLTNGGNGVTIWNTATRSPVCTLPTPSAVNAVAYRPTTARGPATMIAAAGENDTIYLWLNGTCATKPIEIPTNQFGPTTTMAFSPDGTVLAAGSDDGTILLERSDLTDNQGPITLSQPIGHLGPVTSIAFSPNGHTMASGSNDGKIMLWNVADPRDPTTIATLPAPDETVISMAFSGDGATLASSADNRTISLWTTRTPTPGLSATLTGLTNPSDIVFEPNNQTVISAAADGTPLFWDTDPNDIATKICTSHVNDVSYLLAPYLTGAAYQPLCPAR